MRIAMIAMTTNNSIKVKPARRELVERPERIDKTPHETGSDKETRKQREANWFPKQLAGDEIRSELSMTQARGRQSEALNGSQAGETFPDAFIAVSLSLIWRVRLTQRVA